MYFNFITILIILIILIVIIILYFIVRKRHLTTFTTTFTTFIPTKKKNGQNKKENFLVYDYNLNEGGFADFLKYFFKTFYICNNTIIRYFKCGRYLFIIKYIWF